MADLITMSKWLECLHNALCNSIVYIIIFNNIFIYCIIDCICLYADIAIRLNGGVNKLEGRVEVLYQGIWGTICDDGWDDNDTTVVCRQLGFLNGTTTRQNQFGSSAGPVWLSQVHCLGNESKLSHCMHGGAGIIGSCSHAQDVAVQCNPHGNYLLNMWFNFNCIN